MNEVYNEQNYQKGMECLESLPEGDHFERVFKWNNIAVVQMHCLQRQLPLDPPPKL